MRIGDIAITSLDAITAFDVASGDYLFTLDELQNASISQTEEKRDIIGAKGRKITSLKRNKSVTVSASNGMLSSGLIELQTGGKFEDGQAEILWTDYLAVTDNKATTTYKAVGTSGAEISELYTRAGDGTLGEMMEQNSAAGENQFAYNPDTKELTFADVEDGTEIVVYYMRKVDAIVLENHSSNYAGKAALYIDATGEDRCANVFRIQIFLPKVDINGEFTINFGDEQTVHQLEAEALAGACGASAAYFNYTIFGVNAEDVA